MLSIEARRLSAPDYKPEADWVDEAVWFNLQFEVGEVGTETGHNFQVTIATPEGLRNLAPRNGVVLSERALLVLSEFSWRNVRSGLAAILRQCEADSWERTVVRLQRYFHWEYEDYK